ncbi:MAG: hypothetical protein K0Q90_1429 [Paenibacillaceae bacterium]|nr:hypothetical protein [Paenibacillaceae bacterium]
MNEEIRLVMEHSFDAAAAEAVLEEGLVRYDRPGHTRQMAQKECCHEGRYSAGYYTFGTLLGKLAPDAGLQMLEAIAELQITDAAHPQYGGFRWYREETEIQDSNAAFFILMPLVTARLCCPDDFPREHTEAMDRMLAHAAVWFSKECREPQSYYPNKTMSDGAMLLAVAMLSKQEEYIAEGIRFFQRWEEYTARRGWGWGENISLVYQGVMMNALRIAVMVLQGREPFLAGQLDGRMGELQEILRFHAGEEPVPSIRSYNFKGETKRKSLLWAIAGVSGLEEAAEMVLNLNELVTLMLFEPEFAAGVPEAACQPIPRTRRERIFDDAHSYSWIGHNVRLGTVSRFPVIPGSYQWPTWGLAWQSFPVSFSVKDRQVSYLRWYADLGDEVRTHPGTDYKHSYLKPSLFHEPYYPEIETRTAQAGPAALVIRSMSSVSHQVKELADEWLIQRFGGKLQTVVTEEGGREWTVLAYPQAAVAITALKGITAGSDERISVKLDAVRDGDALRLRQVLYSRSEAGVLIHPRLESGWAVVALDDADSEARIQEALEAVRITDRLVDDREVPRTLHTLKRYLACSLGGTEEAVLELDPHIR